MWSKCCAICRCKSIAVAKLSNNNSSECWSTRTTCISNMWNQSYSLSGACKGGTLYVKATSGAYLHHLTRMDTYIYIHFFHKNIGKDPFFTKPRVALNPNEEFRHTHHEKGHGHGEQLSRGLEQLHPQQERGAAQQRPGTTAPWTGCPWVKPWSFSIFDMVSC
jgi:hypothetical protein